jgi:hypothetical protein
MATPPANHGDAAVKGGDDVAMATDDGVLDALPTSRDGGDPGSVPMEE